MTDNSAVLRRFIEEASPSGDAEAIAACVHPDAIFGEGKQLEEHRQTNAALAAAIGDFAMKVQDTVSDGDKVAARITITGKHIGDFMGQPASGKRFEIEEILIAAFRDGRISRVWRVYDMYSLMKQLGALPS
jgi:steroid delta-isomerase-like uncharacterized protein